MNEGQVRIENRALTPEERLAARIDTGVTGGLPVSVGSGSGLGFVNMGQVMEFAKVMAIADLAIPAHLRGKVGACLGVVVQSIEWEMSPFAVANKSYSVNGRLAYEAQLINAVLLRRAPIRGRIKMDYIGVGPDRICHVWVIDNEGEKCEYHSPRFADISPKNSPLWKTDPDQQQFYYSSRALARRHFPDVLLGIYGKDELEDEAPRAIVPRKRLTLAEKLETVAQGGEGAVWTGPAPQSSDGASDYADPVPQEPVDIHAERAKWVDSNATPSEQAAKVSAHFESGSGDGEVAKKEAEKVSEPPRKPKHKQLKPPQVDDETQKVIDDGIIAAQLGIVNYKKWIGRLSSKDYQAVRPHIPWLETHIPEFESEPNG